MISSFIATMLLAPAAVQSNPYSLGLATTTGSGVPKVVVLLHGATPSPEDKALSLVPEPDSGTLDFTHFYFSYPFVREVMGDPSAGLKTLGGVNVTGSLWDQHGAKDSNNKVVFSNACRETTLNDHLIVRGDFTGTSTPTLSLLLTYRDASKRLMPQAKDVVDLIYDKYVAFFGSEASPLSGKVRPSIIFVTHSMGGSVARAILSAPTDPIQGLTFSTTERQKAEALRDKTISVVTLATPHEGSPLATRSLELADWLTNDGKTVIDAFSVLLPNNWRSSANEARLGGIGALSKDSFKDLTVDFWNQMNLGVLSPERVKRRDNTFIPIYTLIGHSPGGPFFSNPDTQWPTGGILDSTPTTESKRREVVRALGLMFADYALHNVPTNTTSRNWGGSTSDVNFDRVARYHRKSLGLTLSEPGEDQGIPLGVPKFYNRDHVTEPVKDFFGNVTGTKVIRTNKDGKIDGDGLVGVASGHGFKLGRSSNFYFDHSSTWNVAGTSVRGSWYRIMDVDDWRFSNHETIHRLSSTGDWIYDNIVSQAGPVPSTGALSVWPALIKPIDVNIEPIRLPPSR